MSVTDLAPAPPRAFPPLTPSGEPFWKSGASGVLHLLRHKTTRRWVHPFSQLDGALDAYAAEPLSGRGAIYTFTVNYQPYNPDVPPPYIIALIQLDEQDDLRLVANIVRCAPERLEIGMGVRVAFERHGDLFAPVFEPDA